MACVLAMDMAIQRSGVSAYHALGAAFLDDPRVTLPAAKRGKFGANSFKVDGKIFAMWCQNTLAVKLPQPVVEAAVAAGRGERLAMGRGRVMKEWLLVREPERRWPAIVKQAHRFVAGAALDDAEDPRAVTARRAKARAP